MSALPETATPPEPEPEPGAGPRRSHTERPADLALLPDLVRAVIARQAPGAEHEWRVDRAEFWCHVVPEGSVRRDQGWKLHVSATPLAAPLTLARAAEVLVAHRCRFKFAGSPARVTELVSGRFARGGSGKFITVYPADDEQFRLLAEELHRATAGLPGPAVLSDRRYRPDSQVFYRYGVFSAPRRLAPDGTYVPLLTDPEGRPVADERNAWYSPPAWAGDPFPDRPAAPVRTTATAKPVLLNGRYLVRGAIQHSNKGGVFRAEDTRTGEQVVVKQARAHVGAGVEGLDVRDLLRREAALLKRFSEASGNSDAPEAPEAPGTSAASEVPEALRHSTAPEHPLVPRLVEVFEQQGSVLMAVESVPGATLRRTVAQRLAGGGAACPDVETAASLVGQLVGLVAAAHERGVTLHDFNPNNIMVTPEGRLLLIDLEMAAPQGERWVLGATPGYTAPELRAAGQVAPALEPSADLFALGATVLHALSGADPLFAPDLPRASARPDEERLARLVELLGRDRPVVRAYAPLVLGLTRDEPAARWSLERARTFRPAPRGPSRAGAPDRAGELADRADRTRERLLHDGLAHLVATMRPADPERLWPSDSFGETCDPVALQHGSAGGVAVLARALRHGAGPVDEVREGLRAAAYWTADRQDELPGDLPGLHFGRSGTAWSLLDAARALDDADLAERAVKAALELPVRWPSPDVTHGAAGAGLAQLHFWHTTGDARFLDRADRIAHGLLDAARRTPEGVFWPVPEDYGTALAGSWHYGFAHGVAGVATFLLRAAGATGDERFRAVAVEAGETLATAARSGPAGTLWPVDRARHLSDSPDLARHWCSGSSGVGTFLVRLWAAGGATDDTLRALVDGAADAVTAGRVTDAPAACHGLAGNAELLLDVAELTGDDRYRADAELLVEHLAAQAVLRDGRLLVPEESRRTVLADYGTGLSGSLSLLLRMRHRGPRAWLPEDGRTTP
ncbi:lanthionine synthetase LanC family protein [Streptomyces sp. NPDC056347]|uniref:class III lanthionine synthetase LanKC N-terminal domain-containing protein n=1 Tax=Streptomyces sp. NPDC056347 TaxID=3345790 RepID=UPI0035D8AEAD